MQSSRDAPSGGGYREEAFRQRDDHPPGDYKRKAKVAPEADSAGEDWEDHFECGPEAVGWHSDSDDATCAKPGPEHLGRRITAERLTSIKNYFQGGVEGTCSTRDGDVEHSPSVPVTCNGNPGTYFLDRQTIACSCRTCEAKAARNNARYVEMTPTQFERHSG